MLRYFEYTYLVKGNGMFPPPAPTLRRAGKRRILAPEQPACRQAGIAKETKSAVMEAMLACCRQGRRTERSRGNVPLPRPIHRYSPIIRD